jgi:hypothetical protein
VKATSKLPYCPIPDLHERPAGLAVVELRQIGPDHPEYAAGFQAGVHWALEMATFTDLERIEAAANSPAFVAPPFVRGFVDGALASWEELGVASFGRAS